MMAAYFGKSPASYFEEAPPGRIGGFEVEHDARTPKGTYSNELIIQLYQRENFSQIGLQVSGSETNRWLSNGSLLQLDVEHAEAATAECKGPYEATVALNAASRTLGKLAAVGAPDLLVFRRSATVELGTGAIYTKGFHANLCVPDRVIKADDMQTLESHLATQSYAWGGMVTPNGYNICPKAMGVGAGIVTKGLGNRTEAGKKSMGILRAGANAADDTNSGNFGFARFEDRSKTPSTPWSDFMGMATTSLLLRVLERPELQAARDKLRNLALTDPVHAFKIAGWDKELHFTHSNEDNKEVTMATYQYEEAHIVAEALQNVQLPNDEQYALEQWIHVSRELTKAKDKPDELLPFTDHIGWVQKYHYLTRKFGSAAIEVPSDRIFAECLHWDRIYPTGKAQKLALDRDPLGITAEQLDWYVTNPPQTTRARQRGAYIQARGSELHELSWSSFLLDSRTRYLNPYDNRLPSR